MPKNEKAAIRIISERLSKSGAKPEAKSKAKSKAKTSPKPMRKMKTTSVGDDVDFGVDELGEFSDFLAGGGNPFETSEEEESDSGSSSDSDSGGEEGQHISRIPQTESEWAALARDVELVLN